MVDVSAQKKTAAHSQHESPVRTTGSHFADGFTSPRNARISSSASGTSE
jgi:hypothetical protein